MRLLTAPTIVLLCSAGTQSAVAQRFDWQRGPRMTLERQFAGPLTDTIIQRLRDPVDGSVCYIYLPISASHSEKTGQDYVQYGANTIGSITCTPGSRSVPAERKK